MGNSTSQEKICKNNIETMNYTLEEVSLHNKKGDAWMIIDDKVYNVSNFHHPGGYIIKKGYGIDATSYFYHPNVKHSSYAKKLLKKYYIGNLRKN